MLECVVAACQLWCWVQHWRYDLGSLMKCVCKVSIYHPPKNQHIIMLLHNCSLPWILRRSPLQGSENMNTLWRLLANNRSNSYVRMVLEECMDQLLNILSYLSITSVICRLHLSTGTCSLELVFSLIRLVPRNIFMHNPSYHHILASAHAPQSQIWQYPWSEIGSQQGWSCWQFQCIESICTKMQPFLFRKAREQLRYDGGIEPSCAWRWFFQFPVSHHVQLYDADGIFWFSIKETTTKNASYISITYALSIFAENWSSSPLGIKFPDFYCSSAKKSGNEEQLLKEIEWCSEISVIAWY